MAEYALKGFKAPIGVAEWTDAINKSRPEEFRSASRVSRTGTATVEY
ncbi:hypothetical protein [Kribbella sp. NPDC048915]